MVRLPRWIQLLRWHRKRRERKLPSHEVFSDHVASIDSIRRYSTIVDIRSTQNGYKLSFEMVMILALVLSEGYELFPAHGERRVS